MTPITSDFYWPVSFSLFLIIIHHTYLTHNLWYIVPLILLVSKRQKWLKYRVFTKCNSCSNYTTFRKTWLYTFRYVGGSVAFKQWQIWHSEDRASWYILIIKANEMHYFSNLFWCRTLHVSDRSTVHHQESQHCILAASSLADSIQN
jgi:hypothetical protein